MVEYSAEELAALKKEHAANATDEQFQLWIAECRNRNLAPVRDILMQIRTSEEYDPELKAKVKKKKSIYIVTIGAKRKIANATGLYAGQLPTKWIYLDPQNQPTIESEIPLPDPTNPMLPLEPWAVRTSVLRTGFQIPLTVVSRFGAYCQTYKKDGEAQLTAMWSANGRNCEMLEKCSESACLTRAFPSELSGLFIQEELQKDDVAESIPVAHEAVVAAPKAPTVPKVNHEAAQPTNEPRPGADKTLVEVILDKPAETVQKMDKPEKPKKLTAKEKTNAALEADHKDMLAAIDEKIAENQDPEARLPNDDEKKDNSARIRALIELGLSASEKSLLQKFVEAGRPLTEKLQSDWKKVLTQLEAAGTKEAVLALINPEPEPEF
jgi:hypothetical protein